MEALGQKQVIYLQQQVIMQDVEYRPQHYRLAVKLLVEQTLFTNLVDHLGQAAVHYQHQLRGEYYLEHKQQHYLQVVIYLLIQLMLLNMMDQVGHLVEV